MNEINSIWVGTNSQYMANSFRLKYNWLFSTDGGQTKTSRVYKDYNRLVLGIL